MPLTNFGSVLSFAAELETQGMSFYDAMSQNPICKSHADLLRQFSTIAKKNHKLLLRARQENVTEMILEPIMDFVRAPFLTRIDEDELLTVADVISKVKQIEAKRLQFYTEAAGKLSALPEVARVLKTVGKKHAASSRQLESV